MVPEALSAVTTPPEHTPASVLCQCCYPEPRRRGDLPWWHRGGAPLSVMNYMTPVLFLQKDSRAVGVYFMCRGSTNCDATALYVGQQRIMEGSHMSRNTQASYSRASCPVVFLSTLRNNIGF